MNRLFFVIGIFFAAVLSAAGMRELETMSAHEMALVIDGQISEVADAQMHDIADKGKIDDLLGMLHRKLSDMSGGDHSKPGLMPIGDDIARVAIEPTIAGGRVFISATIPRVSRYDFPVLVLQEGWVEEAIEPQWISSLRGENEKPGRVYRDQVFQFNSHGEHEVLVAIYHPLRGGFIVYGGTIYLEPIDFSFQVCYLGHVVKSTEPQVLIWMDIESVGQMYNGDLADVRLGLIEGEVELRPYAKDPYWASAQWMLSAHDYQQMAGGGEVPVRVHPHTYLAREKLVSFPSEIPLCPN